MKFNFSKMICTAAIMSLSTGSLVNVAFAKESNIQIAKDYMKTQSVMTAMQNQLARHSSMSEVEIHADMNQRLDIASQKIDEELAKNSGADNEEAMQSKENIAAMRLEIANEPKAVILANEQAEIQQLNSSDGFLFYFTDSYRGTDQDGNLKPLKAHQVPVVVLTGILDIATLPIKVVVGIVIITRIMIECSSGC